MIFFVSGTTASDIQRFGLRPTEERILQALNLEASQLNVASLFEPFPENVEEPIVIFGGSPSSVLTENEWQAGAEEFARRMVAEGKYVLGICFGMQLLAKALGGTVSQAPCPSHGIVGVEFDHSSQDPLLKNLPEKAFMSAYHYDCVLDLPSNEFARTLARNRHHKQQMVRMAERVWGVQFHPEMNEKDIKNLISFYPPNQAPKWESEELDELGSLLMQNFFEHACTTTENTLQKKSANS